MFAQNNLVLKSAADISRALAEDQIVTTAMLSIKLTALLAPRFISRAYTPSDRDANAEASSGHIYGMY